MRTATLYIPGSFEDAYVYMGWLMVLTAERSFRFYRIDEIVAEVANQVPGSAYMADLIFRHNEWLTSSQFKSLTDSTTTKREIVRQFEMFPQPHFEVSREVRFNEHDIRIDSNVVLDCLIYNRQIYVGSKDGLFSGITDWDVDTPLVPRRLEKRLDARCLNLTGRFGAIVASCGDEGLLWSPEEAYFADSNPLSTWKRVENKSVKARWLANDIINYTTTTDPNLLGIKRARSQERIREEDGNLVVTAIGEERLPLQQQLLAEIRNHSPHLFDENLVQYIFNSEKVLFIYTLDGHFFALDVKRRKARPTQFRFSYTYKGADTRILSAATTKLGAVLETGNRIWHFADRKWTRVLDSAALSVRTFPQAKNFHNLVAITTEDGVFLVGLFDDTRQLPTM